MEGAEKSAGAVAERHKDEVDMTMNASAFSIYQNLESLPNKNLCVQGLNVLVSIISVLPRLDTNIKAPQVLIVCASKEDAAHIQKVITHCTEGQGKITARLATPSAPERPSKRAMVEDQVVVGTSGTMKSYITSKWLNTTSMKIVLVDEADGMFDQHETGRLHDTKKMLKIINPSGGNCQVILLSETSSERVKRSAMKEFREVGSWSSVVLEKPSHDLNCQYQIAQSCPETLSKISALKKDVDAAGMCKGGWVQH
ncbi:hypothetical protein KC19_8G067500 [Ceratodon purpureus]|uniref:Helicase ATP-binding domain-containing protein n=1 Tax=Ceratodon purpureus TaxID=3225 RepID=A0A8T0GXY8_CERPU|nr:hypothetical protein KC19_8G067500 [Ceratodon purpureus]